MAKSNKIIPLEIHSNIESNSTANTKFLEEYDMFERGGGNNYVLIDWVVGNTCDYSCTYCSPENYDGSSPWPSLVNFKHFVQVANNVYTRRGKKIHWNLLGGELSVWKDFDKALEIIKEESLDSHVSWQSNGSRSIRWWKKNAHLMNTILFSYHPEFADYKHMTDVVNTLVDEGVKDVSVALCVYPSLSDLCFEAADYFIKNLRSGQQLGLKPLQKQLGYGETLKYEDIIISRMKQYERINLKDTRQDSYRWDSCSGTHPEPMFWVNTTTGKRVLAHTNEMYGSGTNTWKGWDCNVGLEKMNVTANGNVVAGSHCGDIHLGHITAPHQIKWPTHSKVCTWDWCPCGSDITTTKYKKRTRWIRK